MTETTDKPTPTTSEEYAIKALTIQGTFFERRCQEIVHQAAGWSLKEANFPVEHNGTASELDIWAERKYPHSWLVLPIECKKNNPEFVDWIFFPRPTYRPSPDLYFQVIEDGHSETPGNWASPFPIRWAITHDPQGKRLAKALMYTGQVMDAEVLIRTFMQRWPIEIMFEENHAHLEGRN